MKLLKEYVLESLSRIPKIIKATDLDFYIINLSN